MTTNTQKEDVSESTKSKVESLESDFDKARESIRSEHTIPGESASRKSRKGLEKFKESSLLICSVTTSAVAVGGLLFTIYQFDKTMNAQRHATAEAAVGQFIAQVTELRTQELLAIENGSVDALDADKKGDVISKSNTAGSVGCSDRDSPSHSLLDNFIVSRAQMLIDGEETGRFAGDILRFLSANQYGHFIGRKPCPPGQRVGPRVSVEGLVLVESKIAHANVKGVFLRCVGFDQAVFDSVAFSYGNFQYIDLVNSTLLGVDFSNSWLSSISFADTELSGSMKFNNATLFGVNFSGSELSNTNFSFEGARIIYSDLSASDKDDGNQRASSDVSSSNLAVKLSKANSLWNTRLDKSVSAKLQELMSEEAYHQLVVEPPENFENIEAPELDWKWDAYCPPQQRRDRRLNPVSEDSLSMVRAMF